MGWKKELWQEWNIVSILGSGAYGKVYKIKREDIGGTYFAALKVIALPHGKEEIVRLRNEGMNDRQIADYYQSIVSRLSTEFSVMERLKGNTNIVSYEDHKIVQQRDNLGWYILIRMELLTPLWQYLDGKSVKEAEVVKIGIDVCNALTLCEREKIIHRDVKPDNIFISAYGDFKLGDFGIAKPAALSGDDTHPRGTFFYMAPEVFYGKAYDSTIDTYSLGLILYQLLNQGRMPFLPLPPSPISSELKEAANERRLDGEPFPVPCEASVAMTALVLKACSYEPSERYSSAAAMLKALKRCSSAQGVLNATKKVAEYVKLRASKVAQALELQDETVSLEGQQSFTATREENQIDEKQAEDIPEGKNFFFQAGDL